MSVNQSYILNINVITLKTLLCGELKYTTMYAILLWIDTAVVVVSAARGGGVHARGGAGSNHT